jgi:predicted dehydrogenase
MTFKLGITGTGYIAKIHAQAARNLSNVKLAAVVNHRPESMAAFAADFEIPRQYPDVETLLHDGIVDALIVSTPNYLHAPQTIRALNASIPVMVEKPMALNATEAAEMQKVSQKSGTPLMVAHCWRFHPQVRWLRQQIEAGKLGPIVRTKGHSIHVNWGPAGWFTEKELAGGGAMADMGIHALDTARYLLGDPRPAEVYASIGTHYKAIEVDDTAMVLVRWEDGVTTYFETGWWQPASDGPRMTTQLYGRQGFGQVFPTRLVLPSTQPRETEQIDSGFPPELDVENLQVMYDAQLAHFVTCVQEDRKPNPDGVTGWINMRVIDAAYQSADAGKLVRLDARS